MWIIYFNLRIVIKHMKNMIKRSLFNRNVVWSVLFVLSILLLASCDLFWSSEPKREEVPLDHIMIPPTKRTDYIGLNIADSVAIFYTLNPYKGVYLFAEPNVDCIFYSQWYNYKGESWFLFRSVMGTLHPNYKSFVSIHLQMSPKDWVVHKASVFFHDHLSMDQSYIPNIFAELERQDEDLLWVSLVAREDLKVDIYKKMSSEKCVKGVITGSFTQWSNYVVEQDRSSRRLDPPYTDFYPEEYSMTGPIYYTSVDEPKRFQLSFTAIESLDGYPIIEIASEE